MTPSAGTWVNADTERYCARPARYASSSRCSTVGMKLQSGCSTVGAKHKAAWTNSSQKLTSRRLSSGCTWQGTHREGSPSAQPTSHRTFRSTQLFGHSREPRRERALWPRPRCVHRCQGSPCWALCAGQRRNDLSRRNWRPAAFSATETSSSVAGANRASCWWQSRNCL